VSHSSSVFPASSLNHRETDVPRGKPPASIQFSCQFQQPWEFYGKPWGDSLFPHLLRPSLINAFLFEKIAQREVTFYTWRIISIHRLWCGVYGLQMINTFTDSSPGEYPQGLKCVMHSRHPSVSYRLDPPLFHMHYHVSASEEKIKRFCNSKVTFVSYKSRNSKI